MAEQYVMAPHQPVEVVTALRDAGLFVLTMTVPDAGTVIPQHAHDFAHVSLLSRGAVRAWKADTLLGEFSANVAPVPIVIEARTLHRFETLTPGVVLSCIHALHGHDEPPVSEFNGLDFVDREPAVPCAVGCPGCRVPEPFSVGV